MQQAMLDVFCYTSENFEPRNYMRGYVFTKNALVMGTTGLTLFQQKNAVPLWSDCQYGRFLFEETLGDTTVIRTDPLGQEPLYYWQQGERWAVSNSVLLMVEQLKSQGVSVQPYQAAIDTFKMANQTLNGGQLLSGNTVVTGIKVVPLSHCIQIIRQGSVARFSLEPLPQLPHYRDYQDAMFNYCSNWLGRVEAMARLKRPVKLALSGGFDSRSCLAILQNGKTSGELMFSANSHSHDEDEFWIAKSAMEMIGEPLFKKVSKGVKRTCKLAPHVALRNSLLVHAGAKTNFGLRARINKTKDWHCIGGSVIGTFTMRNSFQTRSDAIQAKYSSIGAGLSAEIASALNDNQIDPNDELAMFHHYYHYRARFHYGMDLYTSQHSAQLHPLLDPTLIQASVCAGKDYVRNNNVNRDIMLLMRPELLQVPFDGGRSASAESFITSFGASDLQPVNYELYGVFDDGYAFDANLSAAGDSEPVDIYADILAHKSEALHAVANQFGFSDDYYKKALNELKNGSKFKKAGVLLGLLEIFD